ncbi:hypothetical protein Goshw_015001 [Gossypium schwendimanii]|uniref:EF-hand domain-containing protein n=6 Tax=Gossypium TaxID=3633 RepID=A0A0D2SSN2_GOSRA|nr:uncharacterized protein LOC105804716 [Gossypium raimondii]KAH1083496.1 hypothetical protein J1N35_023257 [Gossypium stocksii]MBA0561407.1 hypothetical protein [Gossypium lobatum]MBA0742428.1 hypothetical protein [Gossypium gossypioides]MBA0770802.1 hypothetical protein [Gossypium trilobum]MBA0860191.1 hypothetical protein [Gossypium schwendimanii]
MSVAVLDSKTVTRFVEAKEAFKKCVEKYFKMVDSNGNGVICRRKLREGLDLLFTVEHESTVSKEDIDNFHSMIFDKFDEDRNGKLDLYEFAALVKEIMMAMARGMGSLPVIVALDQDSLLMMAVQHEIGS